MLKAKKYVINQSIICLIQIAIRKVKVEQLKQTDIIIAVSKSLNLSFRKVTKKPFYRLAFYRLAFKDLLLQHFKSF